MNDKIALLDLGMVAHVSPGLQERLLQLLLAVADNRADDAAQILVTLGEFREDADQTAFERGVAELIAEHQDLSLREPQAGRAVLMLLKVAGENGIRLPPELAMIGKTLLNLDEIGQTLAPRFDPNAAIRRHAGDITEQQMQEDVARMRIGMEYAVAPLQAGEHPGVGRGNDVRAAGEELPQLDEGWYRASRRRQRTLRPAPAACRRRLALPAATPTGRRGSPGQVLGLQRQRHAGLPGSDLDPDSDRQIGSLFRLLERYTAAFAGGECCND